MTGRDPGRDPGVVESGHAQEAGTLEAADPAGRLEEGRRGPDRRAQGCGQENGTGEYEEAVAFLRFYFTTWDVEISTLRSRRALDAVIDILAGRQIRDPELEERFQLRREDVFQERR